RCKRLSLAICLIGVGTAIPILISIFWFVVRGSGQAYLDFGLLYNVRYSGSWELPFSSPILHFLFSLPGKILLVSIVGVTLTLARKIISPATQFGVLWFFLSLVAATLSNRPYPHYYLQSLVPLALIIGIGIDSVGKLYSKKASKIQGNLWAQIGIAPLVLVFFVTVLVLLNVSKYPTISYYQQWWQLVQGTKSPEEFRNGFNHLMADNYAVATKITSSGEEKLFIWGTNPMLYALTNTTPTGRFTVSFHIADFDAYDETLSDLKEDNPRYIVVMKDEQHEFNGFSAYLNRNYFVDTTYDNFTLWRRQPFKL
ncbi:MAG: hypothetical protein WAU07_02835, partial [Microgenomates group bacterium]